MQYQEYSNNNQKHIRDFSKKILALAENIGYRKPTDGEYIAVAKYQQSNVFVKFFKRLTSDISQTVEKVDTYSRLERTAEALQSDLYNFSRKNQHSDNIYNACTEFTNGFYRLIRKNFNATYQQSKNINRRKMHEVSIRVANAVIKNNLLDSFFNNLKDYNCVRSSQQDHSSRCGRETPVNHKINIFAAQKHAQDLGLSLEGLTMDMLKSKYKKLARINHPDKNHNNTATQKMQTINEAYKYLVEYLERKSNNKVKTSTAHNVNNFYNKNARSAATPRATTSARQTTPRHGGGMQGRWM